MQKVYMLKISCVHDGDEFISKNLFTNYELAMQAAERAAKEELEGYVQGKFTMEKEKDLLFSDSFQNWIFTAKPDVVGDEIFCGIAIIEMSVCDSMPNELVVFDRSDGRVTSTMDREVWVRIPIYGVMGAR